MDESPVHRWLGAVQALGVKLHQVRSSGFWNTSSPWGVIEFFLADENIASMHAEGELEME
jgi:hypothetical protein